MQVDLRSYNILTPHYCKADGFPKCDPSDLDPKARLERVCDKLQKASETSGVICLQEVCVKWAGPLHTLFARNGYHFVFTPYGRESSGRMGVGIAFKNNDFDAEKIELVRVASTKPTPWYQAQDTRGFVQRVMDFLWKTPFYDPWMEAKYRKNEAIMAMLNHRKSGKKFAVSCYHMPCLFGTDGKVQTVNIHTSLLAQATEKFAEGNPYLIVGDFNFQPSSTPYKLLKDGGLDKSEPQHPPSPPAETWSLAVSPVRSAYAEANGTEPEYTNKAWGPGEHPFVGTLDYIFCSKEWKVLDTLRIKPSDAPSYPTSEEPSDHVMIGATLSLA
eukprot:Sspe_Gene.106898::Locus_84971_Transcript_1_1_Confidence_1.000_Length_1162::g.106898::m.106898